MPPAHNRPAVFALGLLGWLVAMGVAWQVYAPRQVEAPLTNLHSNDFKHLWAGAVLVHHGQSPYSEEMLDYIAGAQGWGGINPYVYLPFTGWAMHPVADLPFPQAARAWFWVTQAMLALAALALCVHLTWGRRWWMGGWLAAALVATAASMHPLTRQLTAGQLNGALVLTHVLVLIAVERRWTPVAGFAVAFAMLFKLSPGLFLLLFLWRRAWGLALWTLGFAALLTLGPLIQVGLQTHLEFLPLLADMGIGRSTWAHRGAAFHADPSNQALGSFLLHIFASDHAFNEIGRALDPNFVATVPWVDLGTGAANALTLVATLLILAVTVCATRRKWAPTEPTDPWPWRLEWGLIVCASLLIPSLMWDHYAVQLLPVLALAAWGLVAAPLKPTWRVAGLGALVAVAWVLCHPVFYWTGSADIAPGRHRGLGLVGMSTRLWGTLALWAGLAAARSFSGNSSNDRGSDVNEPEPDAV